MTAQQGFRISWAGQTSAEGDFAHAIQMFETICTPFTVRQYQLLGLLPPVDTHPRVLDNACGSGRQAQMLQQAYGMAGKPIDITCCDISQGMISSVERRIKDGGWDNVKAHVVNAEVIRMSLVRLLSCRIWTFPLIRSRTLTCRLGSCFPVTPRKPSLGCTRPWNQAPKSALHAGRNLVCGLYCTRPLFVQRQIRRFLLQSSTIRAGIILKR